MSHIKQQKSMIYVHTLQPTTGLAIFQLAMEPRSPQSTSIMRRLNPQTTQTSLFLSATRLSRREFLRIMATRVSVKAYKSTHLSNDDTIGLIFLQFSLLLMSHMQPVYLVGLWRKDTSSTNSIYIGEVSQAKDLSTQLMVKGCMRMNYCKWYAILNQLLHF